MTSARCVACGGATIAGACPRCALSRGASAILARGAATVARAVPDGRAGTFAWKVYDLLEKEGLSGGLRRVGRKAVRRDPDAVARLARARLGAAGASPIVLLPSIDWDVTLFQRPQQLAIALAALGRGVVYVVPNQMAGARGVRVVAPGLVLIDDLAAVAPLVAASTRATMVVSSTAPASVSLPLVRELARAGARVIYDFIDEQHEDVYAISPDMRTRHEVLLAEADLVAVTADRLAEQTRAVRPSGRPILDSANAADVAHFAARPRKTPAALAALGGRAVVGYYGALARWIDWPLLHRLASERPAIEIVLIGADYDRSVGESGIARHPNVHVLGPRRYAELPAYLQRFDVATVPFVKSEVTDATSPIKLFEYLAAEKPVVTTDLRECRKYPSVRVARSADEFLTAVDDAIAHRDDPAERAARRAEAERQSWPARARDLVGAIDRLR
jgi:hypothetical protein